MKKGYDVIIIGGGIIGCSIAFELAKRGVTDILLVEKGFLTSGATGRCGAGIRQQWGSELNARIAMESTHIFENLEEYTVLFSQLRSPSGRLSARRLHSEGMGAVPGESKGSA